MATRPELTRAPVLGSSTHALKPASRSPTRPRPQWALPGQQRRHSCCPASPGRHVPRSSAKWATARHVCSTASDHSSQINTAPSEFLTGWHILAWETETSGQPGTGMRIGTRLLLARTTRARQPLPENTIFLGGPPGEPHVLGRQREPTSVVTSPSPAGLRLSSHIVLANTKVCQSFLRKCMIGSGIS